MTAMPRRQQTFFVIRIPSGIKARAWGKRHAAMFGFDYDTASRLAGELLVWPDEISAAALATNLRAGRVSFRTFRGDPDKMFNVIG